MIRRLSPDSTSAVSTLFCCSSPRPGSHKGSGFSQGPEINLWPDCKTTVWEPKWPQTLHEEGGIDRSIDRSISPFFSLFLFFLSLFLSVGIFLWNWHSWSDRNRSPCLEANPSHPNPLFHLPSFGALGQRSRPPPASETCQVMQAT